MRAHLGDVCPLVGLGIVHLHRAEVAHPVVATHGKQPATVGHQRHSAAGDVHGGHKVPLLRHGVKGLGGLEEGGPIVAAARIDLPVQHRCPEAAPPRQHGGHGAPLASLYVVALDLHRTFTIVLRGQAGCLSSLLYTLCGSACKPPLAAIFVLP